MLAGAERQLRVRHILVRQDQEDLLNEIEAQLRGAQQSVRSTCAALTLKRKLVPCAGSDCNWWHVCLLYLLCVQTGALADLRDNKAPLLLIVQDVVDYQMT